MTENPILTSGGLPAHHDLPILGRPPGAKRPLCGGSPRKGATNGSDWRRGVRSTPPTHTRCYQPKAHYFHHQRFSFQVHLASELAPALAT